MGKSHRGKKTPEQYQKAADLIGQNMPISKALVEAGWSQKQANKGIHSIPAGVLKLLPAKQKELIALGKSTSPEDVRNIVSGRLLENVTQGKDSGSLSCKILGSRRDLSMWTPDVQAGLIILEAPKSLLEKRNELQLEGIEEEQPCHPLVGR